MRRPDPADFRLALSRFATGVTVITAIDEAGEKVGMTVNSFTSVSLSPPTILVSVMSGRTLSAIARTARFAVNVLPASARTLSGHFAGRPVPGFRPSFEETDGMPRLGDAIAYFDCDVARSVEVADHTVLIGTVRDCTHRDRADPLVFYSSRYHRLGG